MSITFNFILLQVLAYLCGSIPFGLLIGKLVNNIDIREHGSNNIGSTNVARTLGKKWGAVVLFLDGLKALIPVLIAKYSYGNSQLIIAITTIVVVCGHIFPVWLKFKGGKGIACILFSLFAWNILLGFLFLGSWILIFKLFKVSALSALSAILITTIYSFYISKIYFIALILLSALTFYKHKENIKRMINGEELKFKKKDE